MGYLPSLFVCINDTVFMMGCGVTPMVVVYRRVVSCKTIIIGFGAKKVLVLLILSLVPRE
jgi:hypothetical protein